VREFLKNIFLFLLPVLLIVTSVNYWGDAANLFSDSYETGLASEIVKGNNVTNILNCDERDLQRLIIKKLDYCPDIVVVGSSRIMEIRESMFKDSSLINNGVSGATIEDLMAMVELYVEKKCLPKKIIIGLDPWTLNKNNEQVRWRPLEKEYRLFLRRVKVDQMKMFHVSYKEQIKNDIKSWIKYYELVSPSYFKSSLNTVLFQDKSLHLTKKHVNDTFTRLSDGSISYDIKYRSASTAEVDKKVSEYIRGKLYSLRNFSELDKGIQFQIECLIKYLQQKNVEIEFFLAPYHPNVYQVVQKEPYLKVIDSEKYFMRLASQYHIKVYGSFDPKPYRLTKASFYDGMHCNFRTIDFILNNSRFYSFKLL
jgi:hypothetical protein